MEFLLADYIFDCQSYVQFLNAALAGTPLPGVRKPRGTIIALAKRLNCHTSFISQILKERAHFSTDQALVAAEHFGLAGTSRDQWLDLVLKNRSGTKAGQDYFSKRLENRIQTRKSLAGRWQSDLDLNELESWQFFSSWLPQMVYSILHLPKTNTIESISQALQLSHNEIAKTLALLEHLKLVTKKKGQYQPEKHWIHLPKQSPVIRLHHQAWRQRAIEEFSKASELKGFHYSGVLTLSNADVKHIHNELLQLMDRIKTRIANSESEESHSLGIDFFNSIKPI